MPQPTPAVNATDGRWRQNINMWSKVAVVLKKNQKTGELTEGYVRGILTSKPFHSRGIKVILHTRQIGRVQHIIDPTPLPYEQRFFCISALKWFKSHTSTYQQSGGALLHDDSHGHPKRKRR